MRNYLTISSLILLIWSCNPTSEQKKGTDSSTDSLIHQDIEIISSHPELANVFNWAKEKARFYVQTGKRGPLDVWERGEGTGDAAYIPSYWAGYPGRSAFYSRDYCHQLVGAHLLGLKEENFVMMKAFAASADEEKKWFPLWAINFDGSPFQLDYRGDDDFVREVPASFELVEMAYELYLWTGDDRYLQDETLWQYYSKAVTDFITLHDTQLPNGIAEGTGKGIFEGAASYNEARDHPLIESGDGIAAQYRAFDAYAKMSAVRGDTAEEEKFAQKASMLYRLFNEEWGIKDTDTYNRGYLADGTAVDGWGKENSWFMPMKGITSATSPRTSAYLDFIEDRLESKDDMPPNIEAISYIPETFFLYHQNERAWKWMKHIMGNLKQDHSYQSATGRNGDYPEVSYVLIRNVVKDLLGLSPNARENSVQTFSHLPDEVDELGVNHIEIGTSVISVKHTSTHITSLSYEEGEGPLRWVAAFPGSYDYVFVNGAKSLASQEEDHGQGYSYVELSLEVGEEIVVQIP